MFLTNLQQQKVDEIFYHFSNSVKQVDFKAPTGSGKTLMATAFIAKVINNKPNDKFIFIIATPSSSNLPKQFEIKIDSYRKNLEYGDFEVEYFESPSSGKANRQEHIKEIKVIQNKVYIFGKATFGKGRIYTEQNIIQDFLAEAKAQNYFIVYIRDEAHIGDKTEKFEENFETLMNGSADFILKMTATPKTDNNIKKVILKENDLIDGNRNNNKWLIKSKPQTLFDNTTNDRELLERAIKKFKEIKEEYKTLKIKEIIHPALLIQVDNEPTDVEKKQLFNETLEMIKTTLKNNNLSWVQYFGNDNKESSNVDNGNFTLEKITRNNDTTDAIIFKIGPATGWDIPRACMLLQLRNVCSSQLKTQTLGRIKRNPYPNLERNEITDKYYMYSNSPRTNDRDFNEYEYKVKENYNNETFAVIKLNKTNNEKTLIDKNKLKAEIKKFLENNQKNILTRINERFTDNSYKQIDKKLLIYSPIILLKLLKMKLQSLNRYQTITLKYIKDTYKDIQQLSNLKLETLEITILNDFMGDINRIIQTVIQQDIKYKLEEETIKPNVYTNIFETNSNDNISMATENYLFNIKKNGENNDEQPLDSKKEWVVFNNIIQNNQSSNIQVWCKNQTTSNIYGEYLDNDNWFRKSYFDFIVKFHNGNLLYIEVKGDENTDIDRHKTEMLKQAYKRYFDTVNDNIFNYNKIFVICLAEVNSNNQINISLYYNKSKITLDETRGFKELMIELGRE